jgi:putative addiction module component (TIGR02574 family)
MNPTLEEISKTVMTLRPDERAELAERIWESIAAAEQAEIDRAWEVEVDRRIQAADARDTPGTPAAEVLEEIEAELREKRR